MTHARVLWSEPFVASIGSDWWCERLERELGLRFHGVSATAARTIAHRFVHDGPEGSLVLRLNAGDADECSVELRQLGDARVDAHEAEALRERVRAALAPARDARSSVVVLPLVAAAPFALADAGRIALEPLRKKTTRYLVRPPGLDRTHHATTALVTRIPGRNGGRLRTPRVLFASVYDGDWPSYAEGLRSALPLPGRLEHLRAKTAAHVAPSFHDAAFPGVTVAEVQSALEVTERTGRLMTETSALHEKDADAAFRRFATGALPLLDHRPGLAAPATLGRRASALAVLAPVRSGAEADLEESLHRLGAERHLAAEAGIHSATFTVVPVAALDPGRGGAGSCLLFTANVAASDPSSVRRILDAAPELVWIWRLCEGASAKGAVLPYVQEHRLRAVVHQAYPDAGVDDVRDALATRDRLRRLLATPSFRSSLAQRRGSAA